jgi:RNA polymerase sigma-70 factor (ECF subfamily)
MEVPCSLRFWSCISRRADCIETLLAIEDRRSEALGAGQFEHWDWAFLRARCLSEALRLLPSGDAEEAVQEALVRAWRLSNRCRTPAMPLPWVLKITRNEALRLIERRARRGDCELGDPIQAVAAEEADAAVTTRMTVQQALLDLEDADRRVLRLRYDEDLTQAEVARRLGMPEGTVKVRLHRARNRLRDKLGETLERG